MNMQVFANAKTAATRRETFKGRPHLVAPIVMLFETVVNNALVPLEELSPAGWNGVPVTLNHPEVNGAFVTANSPGVIEEWAIGVVFGARLEDGKLKGEAWIDIQTAEEKAPGLIARMDGGDPIDVSTGYFPTVTKTSGAHKGKDYVEVHRDLKPDHLAILPDTSGACSWQDGCGVRVNQKGDTMDETERRGLMRKLADLFTNARGSDTDRRQIAADLVSDDRSPFLPDDMFSLMEMTSATLEVMRNTFLVTPIATNEKEVAMGANDKSAPAVNTVSLTPEALAEMIANASKKAVDDAIAALAVNTQRAELEAKVVANASLGITACEAKAMPLSALEKLAAHAAPAPAQPQSAPVTPAPAPAPTANFSGRPLRVHSDDGGTPAKQYAGMVTNGALDAK